MTGRPKLALFSQNIEALGGDDWFFDQVATGIGLPKIAAQVGCSRTQLYCWMDLEPGRRERYAEAKKMAAESLADEAHDIPEELVGKRIQPVDVQLAKLRWDAKLKRAAQLDPENYGEKAGVQITVDIGQLHLDALKAKGSMTLQARPVAPLQIAGPTKGTEG